LNEAFLLIVAGLMLASLTVWIIVLLRRAAGQPILAAEPRRDVPWGWVEILLVLGPLIGLSLVSQAAEAMGLSANDRELKPEDLHTLLLVDAVVKLTLIGFAVVLCLVRGRASATDFGITNRNLGRDFRLGVIGFLATLLPVYCVLAIVIQIYPPERPHPVLQLLAEKSEIAAIVSAAFFAVVFAPLAEEFLFRAFLQGWLEAVLSPRPKSPPPLPSWQFAEVELQVPLEVHAVKTHTVENHLIENPYAPPQVDPTRAAGFIPAVAPPLHTPARPAWAAIIITSIVFAALHASEWPAPVPLFFLALILGYLYNRTHRLLPCIVVHLLFNGLSVAVVLSGVGPN
jgi:membrane protease YdiL (CAAX protease family)